MARFLRASGSWDGPVWAATYDGAAGSAATPTSNDYVYIAANFTVTLTADAACASIRHTNGKLSLSSYTLDIRRSMSSVGYTARTVDLGSGKLSIGSSGSLTLDGGNLTFNAGTSLVEITPYNGDSFRTLSKTFNDVKINMGTVGSVELYITGSPTFRTLDIRSTNGTANTVNFDSGATITATKLVAIGSSSSNKLTVKPSSGSSTIALNSGGSTYGQFVDMQVSASGAGVPKYIGVNSTQSSGMGWLLQDPPKISTLVDPLTTAPVSNPNWTFPDGYPSQVSTGHHGGGYDLTGDMLSTDTYDMVDTPYVFEQSIFGTRFAKILVNSNSTVQLSSSDDGVTWDILQDLPIPDAVHLRSVRLGVTNIDTDIPPFPSEPIGSINPDMSPRVDITYRFDGHNYITNTNDEWTNPSNAADGSLSTSANAYKAGGVIENVLILAGTVKESAPQVSDESIVSVKARIYGSAQGASGDVGASIYDGANYLAAAMKNGTTAGWGPYVTLPVPSGGWTVSKLNNLSARCFSTGGSDVSAYVYRVELLVTAYELPSLLSTGNFLPFFLGGD